MAEMMKKKLILIGGGSRGKRYTDEAKKMEDCFEVVAIAEPIEARRLYLQKLHGVPDEMCFSDWRPLLALPRMADAAIIATMDRDHAAPALAAIEKGYHLLLEKPMSPLPEECVAIERAAERKGVKVLVCHVLRFAPLYGAMKRLLAEGAVGEIMSIQHKEGVGMIHQSHSFVRGNWKNSEESSFMLLQKSCHDMDLLAWLADRPCLRVHSFGTLSHFKEENAPEGAPERCIEGCPHGETCVYNAVKLYLDDKENSWFRCASTRSFEPTDRDVEQALRATEYGKCVYRCSNNVVDHQVVNLEFEGGLTASFTMSAFTKGGREICVMGTKGELRAPGAAGDIELYEFATRATRKITPSELLADESIVGGHGGGDRGIVRAFYEMLNGKTVPGVCTVAETCRNHMIAFAAERSRLEGRVVSLSEYESVEGGEI